jgi:hypothetical protein
MISNKNIDYIWDITTGYRTLSGKYKTFVQFKFIKDCLDDKKNLNILDIGGAVADLHYHYLKTTQLW